MTVLLEISLVAYQDVADTIESMLHSVDLNGPSKVTDSSLSFWSLVLKLKAQYTPALFQHSCELILSWLFGRWKPCKFFSH